MLPPRHEERTSIDKPARQEPRLYESFQELSHECCK